MLFQENPPLRVAVLDMNAGHPNQGMRCIRQIIEEWRALRNLRVEATIFDVRVANQIPDLSYDVYISSGGPGNPLATLNEDWDKQWIEWLISLEHCNKDTNNLIKKHAYFICHSFQMASRHYEVGLLCKRKSTSFGIFPVHMLAAGKNEAVFNELHDPFYVVDSRDYQLIQPNHQRLKDIGAELLCLEKSRPHLPYERAVMGIRFNEWMVGTQFHPEADANGMSLHFQNEEKRNNIIENYGERKLTTMLEYLNDPAKILFTYSKILFNFLNNAVEQFAAIEA